MTSPKRWILGLGLTFALVGLSGSRAEPSPPAPSHDSTSPAAGPSATGIGVYLGISSCANGACHGALAPQANQRILGNEYHTRVLDPHYRAYDLLNSELSTAIADALEPGRRPEQVDLCLDCHTVNVPSNLNRGLDVEDGVSCEGCHGPAGGWGHRHFEDDWSHQQSVNHGMNDLRQAAHRARVCLRCHLGAPTGRDNTGEARTVDHRLIAAGHPILRFELDNYSEEPTLSHWRLDDAGERPGHGIEAWAVGQASTFRAALALLASKAEGDGPWPEFAELNCVSCHHPLDGAWRQQPDYRFRGGLPPWSLARWAVLRHLVAAVAPNQLEPLDRDVEALARQVASMRDRQQVAVQARALADSLRSVVVELERMRWNRRRVLELMRRLAGERGEGDFSDARAEVPDLATAEQVALSLHSLASHLTRRDPRQVHHPKIAAIDGLFAELERPVEFDRIRFETQLARLLESL